MGTETDQQSAWDFEAARLRRADEAAPDTLIRARVGEEEDLRRH